MLAALLVTHSSPLLPPNAFLQGRIAHFVVEKPMVTGHESAGEGAR